MAVRDWLAMSMVVPIQAIKLMIPQRAVTAFRRRGLRGRMFTTIMTTPHGRLTPGYTQSPCSRLWRKLQQHNKRELKTLAPIFMKQERHADHLLPRGSATNPVDSDDWREEAKGETPQVVEETPEEFVRHMLSPVSGPLWKAVSKLLGWTEGRARALIDFGGVYYKTEDAPATARPKRERNPHREVKEGEYLRIFPDPRRYPVCHGVDWESAIVYEAEDVMLVNKPAGVPAHATVDNFHENMLAGLRVSRPELEAFLPHRLDIDTSGLVIVAKNLETLRVINGILKEPGLELQTGDRSRRARRAKREELQKEAFRVAVLRGEGTRVSGSFDGAETKAKPLAGCLRKRYRALVEVLPGSLPLRASTTVPLTHFQKVTPRAPKIFSRMRPPQEGIEGAEAAWIECRMLVLSAREASPPPEVRGFHGDRGVVEDRHGVEDRRFQEIEVELLTGRTHQIRGQLAAEGCPIYGDLLYRQGFALPHDAPLPPSPPQEASVDRGNLDSSWIVDGSDHGVLGSERSGACGRGERPERFVTSPGLALQAHHVSVELGDGVQHAATLGSETCWWAIDASGQE